MHSHACIISRMMRFLSSSEFAFRIGVLPDTLNRYNIPAPDVMIGRVRGWSTETIDEWNSTRPGRGHAWPTRGAKRPAMKRRRRAQQASSAA